MSIKDIILNNNELRDLYNNSLRSIIDIADLKGTQKAQLLEFAEQEKITAVRFINDLLISNPETSFDYWANKNKNYVDANKVIGWLCSTNKAQNKTEFMNNKIDRSSRYYEQFSHLRSIFNAGELFNTGYNEDKDSYYTNYNSPKNVNFSIIITGTEIIESAKRFFALNLFKVDEIKFLIKHIIPHVQKFGSDAILNMAKNKYELIDVFCKRGVNSWGNLTEGIIIEELKYFSNEKQKIITSIIELRTFLLKELESLYLDCNNHFQPQPTEKKTDKLKVPQIALIHVYEGIQITRGNAGDIAAQNGYTAKNSGEGLFQDYTNYCSTANRKGKPTLCTPKKLKNKIELFESVINHLSDNNKQRAIDEINILNTIFENEYQ